MSLCGDSRRLDQCSDGDVLRVVDHYMAAGPTARDALHFVGGLVYSQLSNQSSVFSEEVQPPFCGNVSFSYLDFDVSIAFEGVQRLQYRGQLPDTPVKGELVDETEVSLVSCARV